MKKRPKGLQKRKPDSLTIDEFDELDISQDSKEAEHPYQEKYFNSFKEATK